MEEMLPQQPVIAPVTAAPASSQPVFYSLSAEEEAPRPTPWFQKRQLVALAISVLILMAITAGVIVFAMNAAHSRASLKKVTEQKTAQVAQMVENGSSQTAAARQAAFVDGCKGLSDAAYVNCVSLVAIDNADPTVCSNLTDPDKQTCSDAATLEKAKTGKDYKACDAITDDLLKSSCQASIRTTAASAGDCAGYGVPVEYCDAQQALDAAIATGDPASCATLPLDTQGACEDIFTSRDADKDGMTLAQ